MIKIVFYQYRVVISVLITKGWSIVDRKRSEGLKGFLNFDWLVLNI